MDTGLARLLTFPPTWLVADLLGSAAFVYCLIDAGRDPSLGPHARVVRILELLGFVLYAGTYENGGVLLHIYRYSLASPLLFIDVPISILLIEASVFYAGMKSAESLELPPWAAPVLVGILAMLQDHTIDPVACFDMWPVGSRLEGRWNWTYHYEGTLFGIPFFNYSGWFWMMVFYATGLTVGRRLFARHGERLGSGVGYVSVAVVASLALIFSAPMLVLYGLPFAEMNQRTPEIILLSLWSSLGLFVLLRYRKRRRTLSWKIDAPIWLIPLAFHLYDLVVALARGIRSAYVPLALFGTLHLAYVGLLFRRGAGAQRRARGG